MFQQPPPQLGFLKTAEFAGCLVLVYVKRLHEDMIMPDGKTIDGVEVELHALDGPKAGTVDKGIMTQRVIVGSLRNAVGGDPVLGRIGQGIANPGKSAPWILEPFTDADAALATGYVQRVRPGVQQPGNGQATPKDNGQPAAATPSPATTAAPAGSSASVDLSKLPPEVAALLAQTGAIS